MLTLTQFVDKWNGKGIDWDSHYGFQCVDLYRQYVQEVLGVPQSPGVMGAKDIWDSYLTEYYDKIPNSPTGFPLPGDIMIWGSKYGQYGHVAVVVSANQSSFTCFSQNDPTGALCSLKKYTAWGATLGWLHPKPRDTMYKGYDLSNSESMKVAVDTLVDLQNGLLVRKEQVDQIISDGNKKLVDAATSYEKEKAIKDEQIKALEESLQKLQDTEHTWEDMADDYQRKLVAILSEFAKVGISLSPENDASLLGSTISLYLTNNSPEDILALSEALKKANKTIEELKKKDKSFKTIKLGKLTIKFYK